MRTEKKQKEGRQDNKQSCERDHLFETRSTEVETLPRPTQRPVATYLWPQFEEVLKSQNAQSEKNNKIITHSILHSTHDTHVEVFTLQPVLPSPRPHCVITVLLSPCGGVMTDYGAATEREVSHIFASTPFTRLNIHISLKANTED